jgi:CheY-like chemotaxis protein
LQKSKIERLRESRESRFLGVSTAAKLCRADTKVGGRFCVKRCGDDGRLALSWLAENQAPALILLDLMMPEMDGFEFLNTFNSHADWRHVPVVVITAKQLTAAERGLLSGQARSVIEKGTSIDRDIATAIGKAVGRRAMRGVVNA